MYYLNKNKILVLRQIIFIFLLLNTTFAISQTYSLKAIVTEIPGDIIYLTKYVYKL